MSYRTSSHTLFHHRYHIVWITKYRHKVLRGEMRECIRRTIRQVCSEMDVVIVKGCLANDHIHMFVDIPPRLSVSKFVQMAKGRSSRKVQQAFPQIRKRYWGQHFWCRGYFCTTSGNITNTAILQYLEDHDKKGKNTHA